jgi:chemotaxis protein MotB
MEGTGPVIIKKVKKGSHEGRHGGSWKVAYADFVTAMMAFFLLLWLITMVAPEKRAKVAAYFKYFSLFEKSGTAIIDGGPELMKEFGDETPRITVPQREQEPVTKITKNDLAERVKGLIEEKLSHVRDQVLVSVKEEGVQIQIVDKEGKPIFPLGSSEASQEAKNILKVITDAIKDLDNKITIDGHTDALSYSTQKYTNWELSTDRASAARKEMEKNGLNPDRIARVAGYAATRPLIKEDPNDPRNRRISITVLFPEETTKPLKDIISLPPLPLNRQP